jgi:protein-S-isoprenylcysteine O-methyltransferase Ste14
MQRHLIMIFSIFAYLLSLASIAYAFLFVGNLGIASGVDGPAQTHPLLAAAINTCLICLFAAQHSLMARPRYKLWMKRRIPEGLERSSYILATTLALGMMMLAWQPIGGELWHAEEAWLRGMAYGAYAFGWFLVFFAIALTNHRDLFGLRQAWMAMRQQAYARLPLTDRWLYRFVRHPLYLGWIIVFWAAPVMTWGHVQFALLMTVYIVIAIPFEENDLLNTYGESYARYRERTPKLIPTWPYLHHGSSGNPGRSRKQH